MVVFISMKVHFDDHTETKMDFCPDAELLTQANLKKISLTHTHILSPEKSTYKEIDMQRLD